MEYSTVEKQKNPRFLECNTCIMNLRSYTNTAIDGNRLECVFNELPIDYGTLKNNSKINKVHEFRNTSKIYHTLVF